MRKPLPGRGDPEMVTGGRPWGRNGLPLVFLPRLGPGALLGFLKVKQLEAIS